MSKLIDLLSGLSGVVLPFAGGSAPGGWLLCFGQAVSRTDYSLLFSVIGTTYGAGDGSTTFNLPDMRDKVPLAKGDMGGTAAGLVSSSIISTATLGAVGGDDTHTLTIDEIPTHSHNLLVDSDGSGVTSPTAPLLSLSGTSTSGYIENSGGGEAHANVQPSLVLNYIIKT